jgi:hypothetical protein
VAQALEFQQLHILFFLGTLIVTAKACKSNDDELNIAIRHLSE